MTTSETFSKMDALIDACFEASQSKIPEVKATGEKMRDKVAHLVANNLDRFFMIENATIQTPHYFNTDQVFICHSEAPLIAVAHGDKYKHFLLSGAIVVKDAYQFLFGLLADSGVNTIVVYSTSGRFVSIPIDKFAHDEYPVLNNEATRMFGRLATTTLQFIRALDVEAPKSKYAEELLDMLVQSAAETDIVVPAYNAQGLEDNKAMFSIRPVVMETACPNLKDALLFPAFTSKYTPHHIEPIERCEGYASLPLVELLKEVRRFKCGDKQRFVVVNPGTQNWVISDELADLIVKASKRTNKPNANEQPNN